MIDLKLYEMVFHKINIKSLMSIFLIIRSSREFGLKSNYEAKIIVDIESLVEIVKYNYSIFDVFSKYFQNTD